MIQSRSAPQTPPQDRRTSQPETLGSRPTASLPVVNFLEDSYGSLSHPNFNFVKKGAKISSLRTYA